MKIDKLKLSKTGKFIKHFRVRVDNREDDIKFSYVVKKLLRKEPLELKFKDHKLSGNKKGFRECHIKPDLLLVYQILENEIRLIDIGTHSQLFK